MTRASRAARGGRKSRHDRKARRSRPLRSAGTDPAQETPACRDPGNGHHTRFRGVRPHSTWGSPQVRARPAAAPPPPGLRAAPGGRTANRLSWPASASSAPPVPARSARRRPGPPPRPSGCPALLPGARRSAPGIARRAPSPAARRRGRKRRAARGMTQVESTPAAAAARAPTSSPGRAARPGPRRPALRRCRSRRSPRAAGASAAPSPRIRAARPGAARRAARAARSTLPAWRRSPVTGRAPGWPARRPHAPATRPAPHAHTRRARAARRHRLFPSAPNAPKDRCRCVKLPCIPLSASALAKGPTPESGRAPAASPCPGTGT